MDLTQDGFDQLLKWLDPNRERAGEKYETIRHRLIRIFTCRGCPEAEDLTDETINRVARKVQELASTYTGDPVLYFYGVANKVHLEYLRREAKPILPPPVMDPPDEVEQEYECLEQCMQQLTPNNRQLVLQYYQEEKRSKIDHRKDLARQLGIALNALRIRAHRIRATLQECVQRCLEERTA